MNDKKADLAGPGIGNYSELRNILPKDYNSILNVKDTQKAIFAIKNYIEENLCRELNLMMVTCPLIVDRESGVNDYLDRDGSRTPIEFPCGLGLDKPIQGQVVQAVTKWKRVALKQFGMKVGEEKSVTLKPENAYGMPNEQAIQAIPKDRFPPEAKEGMMIGVPLPNGQQIPAKIIKIDDKEVTLDMNHPMAGKTLIFKIKIVEILN